MLEIAAMRKWILVLASASLLGGCAMVEVRSLAAHEYIAMKRGDILSTGEIGTATQEAIRVAGLDAGPCVDPSLACIEALAATEGVATDKRLAALAELWLQQAMLQRPESGAEATAQQIDAWLETARHAYAYLFFGTRTPGERAFEDRQTQVRDYYNYAVQEAVTALYRQRWMDADGNGVFSGKRIRLGEWSLRSHLDRIRIPRDIGRPQQLIPASSLSFNGLRSTYRRDGFGAELVMVMRDDPVAAVPAAGTADTGAASGQSAEHGNRDGTRFAPHRPYVEMPSPALTVLLHFSGTTLAEILATRELTLRAHDPYQDASLELHGQRIPLAANFTAGYGLWLARTDFATQSLRTLLGLERGIERPHIYLMQPYDPDRRIILMLHGLASSPEAWVNVANEVLGDEVLRKHFQVWQVYYPTNMPIALNHAAIRSALQDTLRHFDPQGSVMASKDIVIVGHSMGGVISRLMVSSSDDRLWNWLRDETELDQARLRRVQKKLDPLFNFEPLPNIGRAVFIAAPHRGTEFAGNRIGRWVSSMIRLPVTVLKSVDEVRKTLIGQDRKRLDGKLLRIPNSIDNLDESDPFIRAAATLPISPRVPYHSIIAREKPDMALTDSDDGVVPYRSAHLAGAASEKIIVSGHSVQETPAAILEIRRILHQDLAQSVRVARTAAPADAK